MFSKLKSGAKKRKEKKDLDVRSSKLPKLDRFSFLPPPAVTSRTTTTNVSNVQESDLEPTATNSVPSCSCSTEPETSTGQPETPLHPKGLECNVTSGAIAASVRSTDRGLYGAQEVPETPVRSYVVATGSYKPCGPLPNYNEGRYQTSTLFAHLGQSIL